MHPEAPRRHPGGQRPLELITYDSSPEGSGKSAATLLFGVRVTKVTLTKSAACQHKLAPRFARIITAESKGPYQHRENPIQINLFGELSLPY